MLVIITYSLEIFTLIAISRGKSERLLRWIQVIIVHGSLPNYPRVIDFRHDFFPYIRNFAFHVQYLLLFASSHF